MLHTSFYRRQHEELERLVMVLVSLLSEASPEELRAGLVRLACALRVHVALEDKRLYPDLLVHPDPAVRAMADEYRRTMGELAPAFASYYEAWDEEAIATSRERFICETKSKILALQYRITMENENLYALVDREAAEVA